MAGDCPCLHAVCHYWKYARVVDLFLQARSNVTVFGECCPSGHDSSLNLIVLVVVAGVVSLSQVDVAFNVLYLSGVDIIYYLVC